MSNLICSDIKASLLAYLAAQTSVHEFDGECVITVPMNTIDNRWIDVTVEGNGRDFFLVHDSGKSSDELFLQGVAISPKKSDLLKLIANRFGVEVSDGRFAVGCHGEHLEHSIWAVAHCSGLAMTELLRHVPNVEEEAVKSAVGTILVGYGLERRARIGRDISAQGKTAQHSFDFVVDPGEDHATVAINILNPGANSWGKAQRYGFLGLDTEESYRSYKKIAVLANPHVWSQEAKKLVAKFANRTVDFSTSVASAEAIVEALDGLTVAA